MDHMDHDDTIIGVLREAVAVGAVLGDDDDVRLTAWFERNSNMLLTHIITTHDNVLTYLAHAERIIANRRPAPHTPDLAARVAALEAQVARLTAEAERSVAK